ncbi:hypothetical protein WJX64_09500 [Leifsonia sp. YIM 134122]|uniref:Uncharacterized protein n=1 Tax=Leifsonia stereocauli TaxID=3134136 RepID=A0ABU9W452_9MICO
MPSEDELRASLHDDAARSTYTDAAHTIDLGQVIRRSRGRRRPRMLLAGGGAALAVVGLAVTAAFGLPALAEQYTTPPPFAETTTPTPEPTPDPTATPTPTPATTASAVTIPTDCSGIYTKDWTPEMGGLVFSQVVLGENSQRYASLDSTFGPALEAGSSLGCRWSDHLGEAGLATDVASIAPELQVSLIEHARSIGYACRDEFEGTRCDIESELESEPGQARFGESHFFRDGIWVATRWVRINPDGYTEDIVTALFGTPAAPPASPVVIPSDCDDIYTKDWTPQMQGLVLNPPWADEEEGSDIFGARDEELRAVLRDAVALPCHWLNPAGASDTGGLVTDLASISPEQTAAVIERMNEIGFSCYAEHGGTRCVTEEQVPDGAQGESHFIRDGIWSATEWTFVSPDGYTADIEQALFGD